MAVVVNGVEIDVADDCDDHHDRDCYEVVSHLFQNADHCCFPLWSARIEFLSAYFFAFLAVVPTRIPITATKNGWCGRGRKVSAS